VIATPKLHTFPHFHRPSLSLARISSDGVVSRLLPQQLVVCTMISPRQQVRSVIHQLTQGTREEQKQTLEKYYLENAYFVHPFCRVPSFYPKVIRVPFTNIALRITSRWLLLLVYQWYKILSPRILLEVESTGKSTSCTPFRQGASKPPRKRV
jgi:hypothetical protein